jgi:hypothetical protein
MTLARKSRAIVTVLSLGIVVVSRRAVAGLPGAGAVVRRGQPILGLVQYLDVRRGGIQRRSSVMNIGCAGRRLTRGSSRTVWPGTMRSRKRRPNRARFASIS